MIINKPGVAIFVVMGIFLAAWADAGPLILIDRGSSSYIIYYDSGAPGSIKAAAEDIQRIIRVSTGVTLPIMTEPVSPMICLGDNESARKAGILAESLPEEGFRILTEGTDIYIAGKDTPDGKRTWGSGFSRGTQFGVYTFLEKAVGVHWLMPGEWGEEVPKSRKLVVPNIDTFEEPAFLCRLLMYVQNSRPEVLTWLIRQKTGSSPSPHSVAGSLILSVGHAWDEYVSKETLREHPEYLAVDGDKNKFCTTNKELIRVFAEGVIGWIDKHPGHRMVSISPADGGSFCKCDRCRRLVEEDPHGRPSYTLNLLQFANEVARIVGEKHPDRLLGTLVYYNYMYPPKKTIKIEPNLNLHLAGLNYYGFGLYKSEYKAEFERVLTSWKQLTRHVSYTSYTNWMRSESGAPLGPGLSILKMELPSLQEHGYEGVHMCGISAWGYGALTNYLFAKMMWDPTQDVDALYREWLQCAYGNGWRAMDRLYRLLDKATRQYKTLKEPLEYRGSNYEVTYEFISEVYLPHFSEIEKLYGKALKKARTEAQRKRLQMFGDNLIIFHYSLRCAGALKYPEKSFFYRSHADYKKFLEENTGSSADMPGRLWFHSNGDGVTIIKSIWAPEKRTLNIPKVPSGCSPPVIDGVVKKSEWKHASVADKFRLIGTRAPAGQPTTVRALYDDSNLYLAFECYEDKMDGVKANVLQRDDTKRIYRTDVVEVFFNYTGDSEKYWHLTVNAGNSRWDGIRSDPARSIHWKSAVKTGKRKWTAELAVPFSSLEIESPVGRSWEANLTREEMPHKEYSSWNSVRDGFLEGKHFGKWVFSKE